MRPAAAASSTAHTTAAAAAAAGGWHSPVPYLFGGLAIMLGLIALALIILACSYRKCISINRRRSSSSTNDDDEEKPKQLVVLPPPEMEPRFVVIMAGDENPTFFAKPGTHLVKE